MSRDHAAISFDGTWAVEDLHSRNGTFLDGSRLAPRVPTPFVPGQRLQFGTHPTSFEVVDVLPPGPVALGPGGALLHGEHGMLVLPDPHDVSATVHHQDGTWVLDRGNTTEPTRDGSVIHVRGIDWTLLLPSHLHGGSVQTAPGAQLADAALHLVITDDGDDVVHAELHVAGTTHELPLRRHLALVLTLAQQRLHDAEQAVPLAEQGWLSVEQVCRQVPLPRKNLALHKFRARRQLAELDVADAEALFESRRHLNEDQLRLGLHQLTVRTRST